MRFLLSLLLLLIPACATTHQAYVAPVIAVPFEDKAGDTVCSWNNLPVARVQASDLGTLPGLLTVVHEQVHATDMYNYKGGCWAFIYRFNSDTVFRLKAEYKAYCIESKQALAFNFRAEDLWTRIKNALVNIDSVRGPRFVNCVF